MEIPRDWIDALMALRHGGFPEAIIAGGALRDLDNGREVKDVDFFVMPDPAPGLHPIDATVAALDKAFGLEGYVLPIEVQVYANCTPDLLAVVNYERDDGIPFQVIVMPPADPDTFIRDQLARFDIGLCRIAYDGTQTVRTRDYLFDQASKSLTIVNAPNAAHLEASRKRVRRLLSKYHGYHVDPGVFETTAAVFLVDDDLTIPPALQRPIDQLRL